MIKLYSSHCPKCSVMEKKLKAKNIEYEVVDNEEDILSVANKCGIKSLPLLEVDDHVMDFIEANKWVAGV